MSITCKPNSIVIIPYYSTIQPINWSVGLYNLLPNYETWININVINKSTNRIIKCICRIIIKIRPDNNIAATCTCNKLNNCYELILDSIKFKQLPIKIKLKYDPIGYLTCQFYSNVDNRQLCNAVTLPNCLKLTKKYGTAISVTLGNARKLQI